MASVFDVARCILERLGPTTAMKLQKLVYYAQAWSLVWDEEPLFDEPIEAWANGPVVPALFAEHRRRFKLDAGDIRGGDGNLTETQLETIDAVLATYGDKPSHWLSDLTHAESPWKEAREGLDRGERGNQVITLASMHRYYESL